MTLRRAPKDALVLCTRISHENTIKMQIGRNVPRYVNLPKFFATLAASDKPLTSNYSSENFFPTFSHTLQYVWKYDRRCDFISLNEGHFMSNAGRSDFAQLPKHHILHQYKITELSKFTQRGAVILRISHNFPYIIFFSEILARLIFHCLSRCNTIWNK